MKESKYEEAQVSLRNFSPSTALQSLIGERFSMNNQVVVLEDSATEIKLVVTEKSLHWFTDLWKVLPKEKKVTIVMGDAVEIERAFMRGGDPYGDNNYR